MRSKNSTLLAFISLVWCPPLPRGGGGSLPGGSSTGFFVDLELLSRSMISCPRSTEVGDVAVPARGSPIARDADGGAGGAAGGLPPHVRAHRRHGPRRRSSFSTTRRRQEKSLKLYVRNFVKGWFSRHAATKGVVGRHVMRTKSGTQAQPKQPFASVPGFDGMQLNNFFSPPPSPSSSPTST